MSKIVLSSDLKLPYEAVTQTFAILAMRGVGKTHTASVFAEELSKARLPYRVIDPTGAWWGLRASADGKSDGFPVTILGGDHGDIPLEEHAGKIIAQISAEEAPAIVLDLSLLSKSATRRFVADFAEELYRRNRIPLQLIIDEADAVAPQKPRSDELRMLGAIDDIVRRGRIRGLGCTLVTQRSAVLNKDVLTQAEVLIALRTAHPRDRAPVLEWMKVHATEEQLRAVEESLASLPKGDAWVMSAGWLDLFRRVHIRERETFNSSATPAPGQRRVEPRKLAPVDLKALQERMAATIERAKAEDPRHLRARIAELEADARRTRASAPATKVETKVVEVEKPVLTEDQVKRLEALFERVAKTANILTEAGSALTTQMSELLQRILSFRSAARAAAAPPMLGYARAAVEGRSPKGDVSAIMRSPPRIARPKGADHSEERDLQKGPRKVLTAIAQHRDGVTREQLSVLTGYKRSSRDTYMQRLRERGLVATDGERITATPAGVTVLGPDFEPLPTGSALLEHWRQRLPQGERTVLEVVVAAYPEPVDRERIAEATEYKRSSRDTFLQRLRSRRLITEAGRGQVRAAETLFAGG